MEDERQSSQQDRVRWEPIDQGTTIGTTGSEQGQILADDEYGHAARITLEQDCPTAPFAITCGVYGWMVHTRFFTTVDEARAEYTLMQGALAALVDYADTPPPVTSGQKSATMVKALEAFLERFP